MRLPSCREIRNHVLALVGFAVAVLGFTKALVKAPAAPSQFATIDTRTHVIQVEAGIAQVNWNDVNLTEPTLSPEDEVSTARSKMLHDFEAR